MKDTKYKAKNGSYIYQRLIEECRKTLQFLLILLSFSTPALSSPVDEVLDALRQSSTNSKYSAAIKTTVKTPFAEDQITEGQITVSGNLSLIDFTENDGTIFLKTATADWKISPDGLVEDISAQQTVSASDFDRELLKDSYQFELVSSSDKQVILEGHSNNQNTGTFRIQISLPEYLLRQVEVFGEDGQTLALVEMEYFEDIRIVSSQKTTVQAANILISNLTEYSEPIVDPQIGDDFFDLERIVRLMKEADNE